MEVDPIRRPGDASQWPDPISSGPGLVPSDRGISL